MLIYGYIYYDYMDIYAYILYFRCLDVYFGCLDLYLGGWTCICVSGLVFLVSGLVFGLSGPFFVACILVGCDYGVRAPTHRGLCACRRRFFFMENDAPGIFEHVFCGFRRFSLI